MTALGTALLVCAAGGLGAAGRVLLDDLIRRRVRSTYPVATAVVNLSGSLLLGLLAGLVLGRALSTQWQIVLGTGLLGGYTTFSTASFETVRLLEDRRYAAAALNGFGMLIIATAAAALGLLAGVTLAS